MGFNFSLLNSRFTLISLNWVQRWSLLCMCWANVVFISNAVLGCAGGVIGRLHHSRPALYLMSSPVLKVWRQYECPHLPRVNRWANAEKESEQLRHSCCLLSSHAILWSHIHIIHGVWNSFPALPFWCVREGVFPEEKELDLCWGLTPSSVVWGRDRLDVVLDQQWLSSLLRGGHASTSPQENWRNG